MALGFVDYFWLVKYIGLILIGIYGIYFGFSKLKKKQMIENIPTSKIRSVAMGLAEIKGKAEPKIVLKTPFSFSDCVYYKFKVEELRGYGRNTHWATIQDGESTEYFYVEDETGKILVDPLKADVVLPIGYRASENKWFKRIRYTEWFIPIGKEIYILGSVKKYKDFILDRKNKLNEKLREIKNNKENLMKFDLNKDGYISVGEWDNAIREVEQQILKEELQQSAPEDDLVIGKGELENVFIISDHSEKALCFRLGITSLLTITISVVTILFFSFSLLKKFNILH